MAKISRHEERIIALQTLYSLDLKEQLTRDRAMIESDNFLKNNSKYDEDQDYYFQDLVVGVVENVEELDQFIDQYAIDWEAKRLAPVDRNILRIAIYEINEGMPMGVAINEAVELAKEFCEEKSPGFINGILARIADNQESKSRN